MAVEQKSRGPSIVGQEEVEACPSRDGDGALLWLFVPFGLRSFRERSRAYPLGRKQFALACLVLS